MDFYVFLFMIFIEVKRTIISFLCHEIYLKYVMNSKCRQNKYHRQYVTELVN